MTCPRIRSRAALVAVRTLAAALGVAACVAVGCGRTAGDDAAQNRSDASSEAATSTYDAAFPTFDGGGFPIETDAAPIDAGPQPIVACAEGGAPPCPSPPSECLDDHTMRFFTAGACTEAGTCDYRIQTMKCDPAPMPPDCYQGGCRIVIVR